MDSASGSIGNMPAAVYTEVVLCAACRSIGPSRRTSASTSATATFSRIAPPGSASATLSWSRSRVSSLSIENHGSDRRSRMSPFRGPAAWRADSASCSASGENAASRPRERIASVAMR